MSIAPIRPEQLRHKITVYTEGLTSGTFGQEIGQVIFKDSIRAFVQPTNGSEFYAAQKINPEANHNIWVRYQSGFLPSMFVGYNSKQLEVTHVLDWEEKRKWLRLVCKELVST